MTKAIPTGPPALVGTPEQVARAEAVAALHLIALRRQFAAIRATFGADPPHRAREAVWVVLEVLQAHLRGGEPIAQRDLVARAAGVLSAPTLSRVVGELERDGILTSEPAPGNASVKRLRPTPRVLEILLARADAAFAEFAAVVHETERRSGHGAPVDGRSRRGPPRRRTTRKPSQPED